ncbi:MAG: hypothetical protein E5Y89_28275, partial [Mesorhizobium sp.]
SVGIEIVNPGHSLGYPDFPRRQIDAVIGLCKGIVQRHSIAAQRVLAHSDVAPGRKVDPGEKFPWKTLFAAGIGHLDNPHAAKAACFHEGNPSQIVHFASLNYNLSLKVTCAAFFAAKSTVKGDPCNLSDV